MEGEVRCAFVRQDALLCELLDLLGRIRLCSRTGSMTGRTIGKYRVTGQLGSGGMGRVFKALDETLDREVAIKILNPGLTDPDRLTRFRFEACTLARLNHPAIATIYELCECDGDLSIVMEFVPGETLEELTRRVGCLEPDVAASIVDQVLSALAHAHAAGIVHCDIKPGNVMVTAASAVKIMDFGTARARGSRQGEPSRCLIGTPAYMPPEQLLGEQVDARTDLYAVGVLMYRLLTGTVPFTADTPIDAMRRQIAEPAPPARRHRPDLPDWCDDVLTRALAKHPSDRFQTAERFREALRAGSGPRAADAGRSLASQPSIPGAARVGRLRTAGSAAFLASAAALLAIATLRAPTRVESAPLAAVPFDGAPLPLITAPVPNKAIAPRRRDIYAFDARIVAGNQMSHHECKCRVVLANDSLSWRLESDRRPIDTVAYDRVESMVYSRGRDPLWNGPAGPTLVVRASRGPLAALGISRERDWLSLRVTDSHLRFVVLRFDDVAQARNAINALEQRIGLRTARLSKLQS